MHEERGIRVGVGESLSFSLSPSFARKGVSVLGGG